MMRGQESQARVGGAVMTRRLAVTVAVLVAFGISTVRAADEVELNKKKKDGEWDVRTGIVTQDNREGVALRIGGGGGGGPQVRFGIENVREVRYQKTPYTYWSAKAQLESGDFQRALNNYKEILDNKAKKPFNPLLLQYLLHGMAKCHAGLGKPKKAISAYERLLQEDPDTRFFTEVIANVVESYMAVKDFDKAMEWLPKLKEAGPKYRGTAELYRAKIFEARKRYSQAMEAYKSIASGETGDVKAECMVGVARCEFARKRYDPAIRSAEKAIGNDVSPQVLAKAYLVKGKAQVETARASSDKEKMKEALWSFLRIVALYSGHADSEPEALLRAGQCFEFIKGPSDRARARDMYNRLRKRYPKSAFGEEAARGLGRVGSR